MKSALLILAPNRVVRLSKLFLLAITMAMGAFVISCGPSKMAEGKAGHCD